MAFNFSVEQKSDINELLFSIKHHDQPQKRRKKKHP